MILNFEMTCLCLRSRQAQFCRERKDLWQFGAFQIVTEDKVTQQQSQHLNSQSCDKETLSIIVSMGCSASSHRAHGKRTLREADLSFLVQNTRLQEAEVRASYRQFIRQHPDGMMDRETFRQMMRDSHPSADIGNIEAHLFRMYDDNEVSSCKLLILC